MLARWFSSLHRCLVKLHCLTYHSRTRNVTPLPNPERLKVTNLDSTLELVCTINVLTERFVRWLIWSLPHRSHQLNNKKHLSLKELWSKHSSCSHIKASTCPKKLLKTKHASYYVITELDRCEITRLAIWLPAELMIARPRIGTFPAPRTWMHSPCDVRYRSDAAKTSLGLLPDHACRCLTSGWRLFDRNVHPHSGLWSEWSHRCFSLSIIGWPVYDAINCKHVIIDVRHAPSSSGLG